MSRIIINILNLKCILVVSFFFPNSVGCEFTVAITRTEYEERTEWFQANVLERVVDISMLNLPLVRSNTESIGSSGSGVRCSHAKTCVVRLDVDEGARRRENPKRAMIRLCDMPWSITQQDEGDHSRIGARQERLGLTKMNGRIVKAIGKIVAACPSS
jgi:hypothetical protein